MHLLNQSVNIDELVSLYSIGDACIVTSLRDGMNLVCYEYIASQKDRHGALILSEFAGAAQSLDGAIIINPWNAEEVADAYYESLVMSDEIKKHNHEKLFKYVNKYTAAYWGLQFVSRIRQIRTELSMQKKSVQKETAVLAREIEETRGKKLVVFIENEKKLEQESRGKSTKRDVFLFVFSMFSKAELHFPAQIGLFAEHGSFYRPSSSCLETPADDRWREGDDGWMALRELNGCAWMKEVSKLMEYYEDRTPGSFVDRKETLLVWNYKECEEEFSHIKETELQKTIEGFAVNQPLNIMHREGELVVFSSHSEKEYSDKGCSQQCFPFWRRGDCLACRRAFSSREEENRLVYKDSLRPDSEEHFLCDSIPDRKLFSGLFPARRRCHFYSLQCLYRINTILLLMPWKQCCYKSSRHSVCQLHCHGHVFKYILNAVFGSIQNPKAVLLVDVKQPASYYQEKELGNIKIKAKKSTQKKHTHERAQIMEEHPPEAAAGRHCLSLPGCSV